MAALPTNVGDQYRCNISQKQPNTNLDIQYDSISMKQAQAKPMYTMTEIRIMVTSWKWVLAV